MYIVLYHIVRYHIFFISFILLTREETLYIYIYTHTQGNSSLLFYSPDSFCTIPVPPPRKFDIRNHDQQKGSESLYIQLKIIKLVILWCSNHVEDLKQSKIVKIIENHENHKVLITCMYDTYYINYIQFEVIDQVFYCINT